MKCYYSDIEKLVKNKHETDNRDYLKLLRSGNAAQLEKLKENEHKRGFEDINELYVFNRIREEVSELSESMFGEDIRSSSVEKIDLLKDRSYSDIRKEAADVANFCHMLIYKCDQELAK